MLGDSLSDHDQIDDLVSIALAVIENDGFDVCRRLHTELSDRHIQNEVPDSAKDATDRIVNVAFNLFANRAEFDAVAAFEWLLSDPTVAHVHNNRNIHFELARAVTANHAEASIEIALKQSDDAPSVAFEGTILSNLVSLDFDKARGLLLKMREGSTRVWAMQPSVLVFSTGITTREYQ